jgi:ABC-2 type transport system permease protein
MIVPILILAEVLIIFSNHMLQVTPFMQYLSAITIFFMTFGIVGLAVGLGAIYPRFHVENPAKIATGFGGVVYMLLSMAFIGLVVMLEARPVYTYFISQFRGIPLATEHWVEFSILFTLALGLNIAAFLLPIQIGIRRLENIPLP